MQLLSAKTNESIWCQSDKQTDAVRMQRISYCILITFNTSPALSIEMSLVLSLAIQRSTLQHFIWYGLSSTLPECAACFYGTASKSYTVQCSYPKAHTTASTLTLTKTLAQKRLKLLLFPTVIYSELSHSAAVNQSSASTCSAFPTLTSTSTNPGWPSTTLLWFHGHVTWWGQISHFTIIRWIYRYLYL